VPFSQIAYIQGDQEGLFELAKQHFLYSAICNTATVCVLLVYWTDIDVTLTATKW
jgi:hypothetical protein